MLAAACELFLGKSENEIRKVAQETLEGHQRAIMGNMTVEVTKLRILTFTTVWANSADDKLMILFLFFPEKGFLTFHSDCLRRRQFPTICMEC